MSDARKLAEKVLDLYRQGIPGSMDAAAPHDLARAVLAAVTRAEAAEEALREADDFLRRLSEWDMLSMLTMADRSQRPATADGPYWQREIARVREALAAAGSEGVS